MKKFLVPLLIVIILVLIGLFVRRENALKNATLNQQITLLQEQLSGATAQPQELTGVDTEVATGTIPPTNTPTNTGSRYRKIYSNDYSLYLDKEYPPESGTIMYRICAVNTNVCINLIQYDGSFKNRYLATMLPQDRVNLPQGWTPTLVGTFNTDRRNWKITNRGESSVYFNESNQGTLIMLINSEAGFGFYGGEYDPLDILKVIDF